MDAWHVVRAVWALGAELTLADDKLQVRPASVLTPELREGLKQHKAEIMEALAVPPPRDTSEYREFRPTPTEPNEQTNKLPSRSDRCPICSGPMTTERGYRCFACTQVLVEERKRNHAVPEVAD